MSINITILSDSYLCHTVCYSGHSDAVMGAIATNNDNYEQQLRFLQNGMYTYWTSVLFSYLFLFIKGIYPKIEPFLLIYDTDFPTGGLKLRIHSKSLFTKCPISDQDQIHVKNNSCNKAIILLFLPWLMQCFSSPQKAIFGLSQYCYSQGAQPSYLSR